MATKGQRAMMRFVASAIIHLSMTLIVLCLVAFVRGTGDFSAWGVSGRGIAAFGICVVNFFAVPMFYIGHPQSTRDDMADAMVEWIGGGDA